MLMLNVIYSHTLWISQQSFPDFPGMNQSNDLFDCH